MALRLALWATLVGAASAQLANTYQERFVEEELAGDIEAGSGEPGSGFPSPPSPPDVPESVGITFTTSMDVADVTSNITDMIKTKFAVAANVSKSSVTVTVTSGSATIVVSIATTSSSQASAVAQSLSNSTSSPAELENFLSGTGIDVTEITSPLSIYLLYPPSAPPPSTKSDGLSGGAIAGIVIGSVLGGILLLFVIYKWFVNIRESPGNAPLVQGVGGGQHRGGVETYGTEITSSPKGTVDVI